MPTAVLACLVLMLCVPGCQRGVHADVAAANQNVAGAKGAQVEDGRQPNALINEQSLYLQQHAYNTVNWYPWGDEALNRARDEHKLIFLSIGYSSCHWCHVMEDEVFNDKTVGDYLNEHYVCIKVDREERPDIDAVYMEALTALRGSGGWPLNMFLTPDLKPFFGDTYMPRDVFMERVRRIQEVYAEDPDGLAEAGSQLVDYISAEPPTGQGGDFALADMRQVVDTMGQQFDGQWGGLLPAQSAPGDYAQPTPKFPTPSRWRFLLHYYRKTGDKSAADMLTLTLDKMADGGLQDQLGGGFHRYSVDAQWVVPHFEKMLYDNAQLAELYTEAAAVFDDADLAQTARHTLDFLVDQMSDGGGLFASYDADSGGVEGAYYVWRPDEMTKLAGERDGQVLGRVYGVTDAGNFDGASVLTRRADLVDVAGEFGMSADDVAAIVDKWRGAMLEERASRDAPALDKKVVTAWNGLAISALSRGYAYFGDKRYLDAALAAADYLEQHNTLEDSHLARASTNGVASGKGVLDDYAALSCGLLELYCVSGDLKYLKRALGQIDFVLDNFARPEGGFYFTGGGESSLPVRKFLVFDSVEPSGNSVMAHALLRAASLTGEQRYYDALDAMLAAHASLMRQAGGEMAWLMDAKLMADGPFYDVVLAGDTADGPGAEMLNTYRKLSPSYAVLIHTDGDQSESEAEALMPPLAGKQPAEDGAPLAFVCLRGTCKTPATTAGQLRDQLEDGWAH